MAVSVTEDVAELPVVTLGIANVVTKEPGTTFVTVYVPEVLERGGVRLVASVAVYVVS